MRFLVFAVFLAFLAFSQASLLVIEEGSTEGASDWRQLSVELPAATFDLNGTINFELPVWTLTQGSTSSVFYVLGSLVCDPTVNVSVAALIGGAWICVDINSPLLPPGNGTRRSFRQTVSDRVQPPASCPWDQSPLVYNITRGEWICANPTYSLIQDVRNAPRPICNDTDLVVFNEIEQWFQCMALDNITFESTITKLDIRWQVPSTARAIGSIASTGTVLSGDYTQWRWSNWAFTASSAAYAYDQTTPPQTITSGGANYVAYTVSTSFVAISGTPPYYVTNFNPIYPGTPSSYNQNLTRQAPGTIIAGNQMTFTPAFVLFAPSGSISVTLVGTHTAYDTATAGPNGGYMIVPISNVTLSPNAYPVVEILPSPSNWYVGTTPNYNPNLVVTIGMWLQYVQPDGF